MLQKVLGLCIVLASFAATAQHQDKVDFKHADVFIDFNPVEKEITGTVDYTFEVLDKVDSVFIDAQNMSFAQINLNGKRSEYSYKDSSKLVLYKRFKKGKKYTVAISYHCTPKQTVYFLGWDDNIADNEQIWTQGQGKYTSHWLPSFDDMEEKVEFDLHFKQPEKPYIIIANGSKTDSDASIVSFDMQNPISSYLVAFALGKYNYQEVIAKSGVKINNYYYPKDSLKVEPTYRYTKEIFDFLEDEIGVPYPWQNYKQIPVHDFLYAGMENTSATIFSDAYVVDSTAFLDKNYVNVNAHELAHQWFGDLVTEKSAAHHWLHEGFATYYAYLAEQQVFGDEHFYWKLYSTLQQLKEQESASGGQKLTDPKAISLTFYEKGAWALFMLKNRVGETAFKLGVENYLTKFKFKNVTVADFIKAMEKASDSDLSQFEKTWLQSEELYYADGLAELKKQSGSIAKWVDFKETGVFDSLAVTQLWETTKSTFLKSELVKDKNIFKPENVLLAAYNSGVLEIRQALILGNSDAFLTKERLFSLLTDASYSTKEAALFKIWSQFPAKRNTVLDAMDNVHGLPNKNIRLPWLTLALLTVDYKENEKANFYSELNQYTSSQYAFEIRMGAFMYLNEAIGFNDESLSNLLNATNHHTWQFKKYARNLLDTLLKKEEYKSRIIILAEELKPEETRYLKSKLK